MSCIRRRLGKRCGVVSYWIIGVTQGIEDLQMLGVVMSIITETSLINASFQVLQVSDFDRMSRSQ